MLCFRINCNLHENAEPRCFSRATYHPPRLIVHSKRQFPLCLNVLLRVYSTLDRKCSRRKSSTLACAGLAVHILPFLAYPTSTLTTVRSNASNCASNIQMNPCPSLCHPSSRCVVLDDSFMSVSRRAPRYFTITQNPQSYRHANAPAAATTTIILRVLGRLQVSQSINHHSRRRRISTNSDLVMYIEQPLQDGF